VRADIGTVVALVLVPVLIQLLGTDEKALEDQALITAALAEVNRGTTLAECNALFTGVSTLP
jgi:hypothetical protein